MKLRSLHPRNTSKVLQAFELLLSAFFAAVSVVAVFSMFNIPVLPLETGGSPGGSLIFVWNAIADTLGSGSYILLPKYDGSATGGGTVFMVFTVILWVLNYLIVRSRRPVFLLIYITLFLLLPLILGVTPDMAIYVPLICLLIFVFSYMTIQRPEKNRVYIYLLLILTLIGISTAVFAPHNYTKLAAMDALEGKLNEASHGVRYGEGLLGGEDLAALGKREAAAATALKVTMSHPDSLYLRGFVGSSIGAEGWEDLDNSEYYESLDLFYWLHRYDFTGLTQLSAVSRIGDEGNARNTIRVNNVGTDRSYIYTPYELDDISEIDGKNYSDAFIGSDSLFGSDEYTYSASTNLVKDWTAMAAEIFSMEESDRLTDYRLLESYYNVSEYEKYTDISNAYKDLMYEALGPTLARTAGHMDYKKAIETVRTYLEENIVYTETVKPSGQNDFVKTFLKDKRGYDVHYASAATLMFRYFGIPSRYVEGYMICPEDVKGKGANSTVEIGGNRLHAWTEIYIDVLGWVPLEVTPEYYGLMEEADLSKGLENIALDKPNRDNKQLSGRNNSINFAADDRTNIPWRRILAIVLTVAIGLLLIGLAWMLTRKIMRAVKLKRSFNQENSRRAVCAIYAFMLRSHGILDEQTHKIGEKAAYSKHQIGEDDRKYMLKILTEMKQRS